MSANDESILFFAMFGPLISNGMPIITTLKKMEKASSSKTISQAAKKIRIGLEAADRTKKVSLVDYMKDLPELFDKNTLKLIKTGEDTHSLDLIVRILPEYLAQGYLDK